MFPFFGSRPGGRKLYYNLDLPSFQRDFASLKTLDHGTGPAITFTRASDATYFDADGVLQTAANDVARFDHSQDGAASSLGLLIEEQRTNRALHSADLANAAWTKTDITAVKDQTGIDGSSNSASSITATDANGTVLQAITHASADRATSAYVKRITGTGDVEMTQNGGSTWTAVTVTADWTRVTIASATVTNPSVGFRLVTNGDAIAVDAVQIEDGAFPTSYIPTTTAAATRSADSAVVTPISSFYNQSEGTLFAEAERPFAVPSGQFPRIADISDGTIDNRVAVSYSSATQSGFIVNNANVTQASMAVNNTEVRRRVIGAYRVDDFAMSANGSSVAAGTTDTSGTPPAVSSMGLSGDASGGNRLNGHIRKIAYWPKRLTNALLEQLTT